VGLLLRVPDFGKFQEAMQSDEAADAMKRYGGTSRLLVLEEAQRLLVSDGSIEEQQSAPSDTGRERDPVTPV
jgi:hypothetical protein